MEGLSGSCASSSQVTIFVSPPDTVVLANNEWLMYKEAGMNVSSPQPCVSVSPSSFWGGPIPGTTWLSNSANGAISSPVGEYNYRSAVELANIDSSMKMVVDYMADDSAWLYFNGFPLIQDLNEFQNPVQVIVSDLTMFQLGTNYLETTVTNHTGPHGFNIKVSFISDTSVVPIEDRQLVEPWIRDLKIFPNPTKDVLEISGDFVRGKLRFTVVDLMGKKLHTGTDPQIDVSRIASGTYILLIHYQNQVYPHRFIKAAND